MPFIELNYNKELNEDIKIKIKENLGQLITILPGKSEAWLMVEVKDNLSLFFKGDSNSDNMMIKVFVYGNKLDDSILNKFTYELTETLTSLIPTLNSNHIYISYFFTENRGWNGSNF